MEELAQLRQAEQRRVLVQREEMALVVVLKEAQGALELVMVLAAQAGVEVAAEAALVWLLRMVAAPAAWPIH